MAAEEATKEAVSQEAEIVKAPAEAKKTEEHMIPKGRLDQEIEKRKELEKRLDAMDKANREAEERRMKEAEDYKGLYEKTLADYNEVKPKAERVSAYQETIEEMLASEMLTIPEDRRTLIPDELSADAKLRYIARNRAMLSKAKPFDIGAGARGGGAQQSIDLSPEEHQMAVDYGMTDEDYAKYKS